MRGNGGNNTLWGYHGHDHLYGRNGNDVLYGQNGNDILIGGIGADRLDGGAGIDRAQYHDASGAVTADLQYRQYNTGEAKGDVYISIENLHGSHHNDSLRGNGGNNTLWGYHGHDHLYGRNGNDVLYGQNGNDKLWGGQGNDALFGGIGNDVLHGEAGADDYIYYLGNGVDRINDYATDKAKDQLFCKFDLSSVNLSLSWTVGDDLLMNFGAGSSVTITDWQRGDNYQVEEFVFNDGTYNADQFLLDHGLV